VQAATPNIIDTTLPRIPSCGTLARRLVCRSLAPALDAAALGDIEVVVSELAENAYLHGRGRIELRVAMDDGRVRIEVSDEGNGASEVLKQRSQGPYGLGLTVVDELSTAWGAYHGSTHVWADIRARRRDTRN
jgi:anti-sigma regulatory factor (Ser/Thr protein kinase)